MASLLAVAGAASAEGNGHPLRPAGILHEEGFAYVFSTGASVPSTNVIHGWSTSNDSPTDGQNINALKVHVPAATASRSFYFDAYTNKSMRLQKPVGDVQNLSFEFRNTQSFGGGAPRISVQFVNGDVGYLSSEYCDNPIAVDPSWSRADFTGRHRVGCSMLVTGDTGGTYSSDGVSSAWDVYASANPEQVLTAAYLVIDVAGDYSLDRIALGTGRLYNTSDTRGVRCYSENVC